MGKGLFTQTQVQQKDQLRLRDLNFDKMLARWNRLPAERQWNELVRLFQLDADEMSPPAGRARKLLRSYRAWCSAFAPCAAKGKP